MMRIDDDESTLIAAPKKINTPFKILIDKAEKKLQDAAGIADSPDYTSLNNVFKIDLQYFKVPKE